MKFLYLLCLPILLSGCFGRDVITAEREHVDRLINNNDHISHHYLLIQGNTLHYAANGDPKKPALIIVHGTPGDWQQYARYLLNEQLLEQFYVVVIDRPGWGKSTLASPSNIASFAEQSVIISGLVKELRQNSDNQAVILMGHSLGASLIPRVAMDYPELIDGLLIFAGTIDPQLTSPRWFNYAARLPVINAMIGDAFQRSNKEIFALKTDITAMTERWLEIDAHIIAVQGDDDGLVYPKNSDYIEAQFNPVLTQVIRLKDEGHLFPMYMREEVVDWALTLLDRANKNMSF